jgi:Fe-Mn family superoxide dismutase
MKKITTLMLIAASIIACNNKKDLKEVTVPSPEDLKTEEVTATDSKDVKVDEGGQFQMVPLSYSYNALEPHIDAKTVEIHFSKHHLGYANNLNKAISENEKLKDLTIEEILAKIGKEDTALKNNGGGYFNHNLYWETMGKNKGGEPKDTLAKVIARDFVTFNDFKSQITEAALKQFGSGWAWLVVDKTGKLSIVSTPNQENPMMKKLGYTGTPILGIDVWEHAYYLNYQNKRKDYVDAFFNVVDWEKVTEKYLKANN